MEKSTTMTAAAIGCYDKWAIHPNQIDTLNEIFSPSDKSIERSLVKRFL